MAAAAVELLGRRLDAAPLAAAAGTLVAVAWIFSIAAAHDPVWSLELLAGSVGSAAAAAFLAGWLVEAGWRAGRAAAA